MHRVHVPEADEGFLWRRTKTALTPALSREREYVAPLPASGRAKRYAPFNRAPNCSRSFSTFGCAT